MSYNPHVDENGNCVNCGTGQLNFDGKSTGCACSRVADAEYETEQRIIKLLGKFAYPETEPVYEMDETQWAIANGQIHQYRRELIALIKGENK